MVDELTSGRRKVPDFEHWESPETRIRWERGLAIVAGMIGVVLTFFFLVVVLPLSADKAQQAATAQPTLPGAQPPAAAGAGLPPPTPSPTTTPTPAADLTLAATSRATPNVRRGPSLDAAIVTQLRPEQKVSVVGRSADNQWLQIVSPDNPREKLWVSADMLNVTGEVRTLLEAR